MPFSEELEIEILTKKIITNEIQKYGAPNYEQIIANVYIAEQLPGNIFHYSLLSLE